MIAEEKVSLCTLLQKLMFIVELTRVNQTLTIIQLGNSTVILGWEHESNLYWKQIQKGLLDNIQSKEQITTIKDQDHATISLIVVIVAHATI